ncbi:hypothetical protein THAOC_29294, partial [Thalassiosira oceanica]
FERDPGLGWADWGGQDIFMAQQGESSGSETPSLFEGVRSF